MSNYENKNSKKIGIDALAANWGYLILWGYPIFVLLSGGGLNYSSGFREEIYGQKIEVLDGITCSFALSNSKTQTALFIPTLFWAGYAPSRGLSVAFENSNDRDVDIIIEKIVVGDPNSGQTILTNHIVESPNDPKSFHVHIANRIIGSDSTVLIHLRGTIVDVKSQARESFTVDHSIESSWGWGIVPGWLSLLYGELPASLWGRRT